MRGVRHGSKEVVAADEQVDPVQTEGEAVRKGHPAAGGHLKPVGPLKELKFWLQRPGETFIMPPSDDLGSLIQDINAVVRATVSDPRLRDPAVRRTLAFLSQVILLVEQAFQDVLTLLIDVQCLERSPSFSAELRELRMRVELLTVRSHYRDAAEICSRLKHLRQNYDTFIRPVVQGLPGFSEWRGLFGLIEEREGRIITLVEHTAAELRQLLAEAEDGGLQPLKGFAIRQTAELRSMLSELHALNGRILGLSGQAGFLELTRDRNTLEREVSLYIDQSTTHGPRVQVGSGNTFNADFVVANSIQNSFNKTREAGSAELRGHLEVLCREVERLAHALPKETAAQLSQDLSIFISEATRAKPRRKWYELSADGLIQAAKTCAGMASPVIKTVKAIVALLGPLSM